MVNSDDVYSGFKKLGKFSYFLFSAPVFILFRYYQRSMLTVFYIGTTLSGFISLIYLLLNSGSAGAYHSIIYGDFSMLIAGINILLSLLTSFNKTDKVLLALSKFINCLTGKDTNSDTNRQNNTDTNCHYCQS
jgi:hypothetical protein